jgi:acyl-coenzyme A synthetase/AMP-(fatty) acid ligase
MAIGTEELLAYVAERVAPCKKVRLLERVDAIPRSPSGKILRRFRIEAEREQCNPTPDGCATPTLLHAV